MKEKVLNPIMMFIIGLILGIISRLLDIFTQNLGNIFSQMAIWILLGVLISIYSKTKKKAMLNIFLFCLGMLITYYLMAIITKGVYSKTMIMVGVFLLFVLLYWLILPGFLKKKAYFLS